jgi:hypothetical protein
VTSTATPDQPAGITARTLFFVTVAAFGGPLALAALYAPAALADVTGSAGAVTLVGVVAFVAPVFIWLRYARDIAGPGGLTAFVEAAAGRRVALVQAAVWTGSYALYLLYTSAYVVYDVVPPAWPGVRHWRPLLAVVLPILIAGTVVAGRRVAVIAIAALGLGQLLIAGFLDVVAVQHAPTAAAFHLTASNETGHAAGSIAGLFVCGSLPLFLGGEVAGARRAFRRVLPAAFVLTGAVVLLAVYPLARDPAFAHAPVPGLSLVNYDVGHAAGVVVGLGVAASVVAVMLLEYVALTRLLHAVTAQPIQSWARRLAVALVVAGPLSLLVNPDRFYDDLLRPSLVLLWAAQVIVVAVFPLYLRRHGQLRSGHIAVTAVALGVTGFGLVTSITGAGGT